MVQENFEQLFFHGLYQTIVKVIFIFPFIVGEIIADQLVQFLFPLFLLWRRFHGVRQQGLRKMVWKDGARKSQDQGPFDDVLQLTDVAPPGIID